MTLPRDGSAPEGFPCESTKAAIPAAGNEEHESLLVAPDPASKTATVEADRDAA